MMIVVLSSAYLGTIWLSCLVLHCLAWHREVVDGMRHEFWHEIDAWSHRYFEEVYQHCTEVKKLKIGMDNEILRRAEELSKKLAEKLIDEANDKAAYFQMRFEELAKDVSYGGMKLYDKLRAYIHKTDKQRLMVYMTEPTIDFDNSKPFLPKTKALDLQLVRFGLSMTLSPETPPEFVSDHIAREVRLAILKKWQSQSILSK